MRLFPFLACLLCASLRADDALVRKAFDHFYNLEYDESITLFQQHAAAQPGDANAHNHVAQAVLYRELFRAGALESELVSGNNPFLRRPKIKASEQDEKTFLEAISKSMAIGQERLNRNPREAAALYSQGVAYGLRANFLFLVKKAWMDALRDATQARKLHNRATEADPNLIDARMVQGLHDYVVGSLQFAYKILGFLVGFRGDKEAGIKALELVGAKGKLNQMDAQILLAAIYRRERQPQKAIPLLKTTSARFPRNYLLRLEMVQMFADLGDKDSALKVLEELENLKSSGSVGFNRMPVEKIYYSRGNLLFWYRDLDAALENLNKVTSSKADLDLNTGANAWLRTCQIFDLKGNRTRAMEAYRQAIARAPDSDGARESRRYISTPYKRS